MLASPLRRMTAGTLVSAIGNGAWYASWAIFLTHSVGLSPGQVGLGMTVAGALGVLAATPIGALADRVGARATFRVLLVIQGLASCGFAAVSGMASFLAVAAVVQIATSATGGPRTALVLELAGERDRLAALGRLRAISHVGWAVGAVLGGVAISVDTRPAYLALLALNGGSYLVYAGLVGDTGRTGDAGLAGDGGAQEVRACGEGAAAAPGSTLAPATPAGPTLAPATSEPPGHRSVLHDRPYVSLAALIGVLALCWAVLSTGLPLWVTLHTHAPRAVSATIVVISSLAIAALQVPANRATTTPRRAARAALLAGVSLAGSCVLFALTAGEGGTGAVALMLAGAALHIAGELLFVAASWGLSVPLMPAGRHGEYQGVFAAGEATALMAAPALMTTLVAGWGQPGWVVLAVIFLIPGAAAIPTTRWALRTRATVGAVTA